MGGIILFILLCMSLPAIVCYSVLSRRVRRIEEQIKQLQTRPTSAQTTMRQPVHGAEGEDREEHVRQNSVAQEYAVSPHETSEVVHGAPPQQSTTGSSAGETAVDHIFEWVRKDFMVKLGAFLLLIAFGWFVSYAFANNWIGPMGRITLGLLAGIGILMLGTWRIKSHLHQGGIFVVLGAATVILTMYAARELYAFFTPGTALIIMFLTAAFVAFLSVQHNSNNLALAGLLLACLSPLFTNSPSPDVVGLFSYLLVIVLGTLWVVHLRGWGNLVFASLVIVFLYGLPYLDGSEFGDYYMEERRPALFFAFLFTALFYIFNILSLLHRRVRDRKAALFTAGGTALYLIAWVSTAALPEWQSMLYIAWMLVFSFGAFSIYVRIRDAVPFYIYGGASIALLAAATAAELSGPALAVAFTIEAGLIVVIALFVLKDTVVASRLSLLFTAPVLMSPESIESRAWRDGIYHEDFGLLLVLTATLAMVGALLFEHGQATKSLRRATYTLLTGAGIYACILVWLVLHALVDTPNTATLFALTIYTLSGLGLYFAGYTQDIKYLRIVGGILIGGVVARLLLVEAWMMDPVSRIITFAIIAVLLLSTAFWRKTHAKASTEE